MSFILDALKKSENDRQEQAEAEFASVPTGSDTPATPRWLWVLGGLLALNIIVVLGLLLRPSGNADSDVAAAVEAPPPVVTQSVATPSNAAAETRTPADESFSAQVASARDRQPETVPPTPVQSEPPLTAASDQPFANSPAVSVENIRVSASASLPSFAEVVANGTLSLPDLRIDIHVYSDVPQDRFVFINMNKYNENATLTEGPKVREITSDGVILEQYGTAFVLRSD